MGRFPAAAPPAFIFFIQKHNFELVWDFACFYLYDFNIVARFAIYYCRICWRESGKELVWATPTLAVGVPTPLGVGMIMKMGNLIQIHFIL